MTRTAEKATRSKKTARPPKSDVNVLQTASMQPRATAVLTPAAAIMPKVLLCTAGKGGSGKSNSVRQLAVVALHAGVKVRLYDLDPQATLAKWAARRPEGVPAIEVEAVPFTQADIPHLFDSAMGYDLAIVDTPPSIEEAPLRITQLIDAADYILVPTRATVDDEESVIPWMRYIRERGKRAAFLINQIKRRTKSVEETKRVLIADGPLCPVEVSWLEDIPRAARMGLACADVEGMAGTQDYEVLWHHIRHELGL